MASSDMCTICQCDLATGPNQLFCNSNHFFHNECYDDFLSMGGNACPNCRAVIDTDVYREEEESVFEYVFTFPGEVGFEPSSHDANALLALEGTDVPNWDASLIETLHAIPELDQLVKDTALHVSCVHVDLPPFLLLMHEYHHDIATYYFYMYHVMHPHTNVKIAFPQNIYTNRLLISEFWYLYQLNLLHDFQCLEIPPAAPNQVEWRAWHLSTIGSIALRRVDLTMFFDPTIHFKLWTDTDGCVIGISFFVCMQCGKYITNLLDSMQEHASACTGTNERAFDVLPTHSRDIFSPRWGSSPPEGSSFMHESYTKWKSAVDQRIEQSERQVPALVRQHRLHAVYRAAAKATSDITHIISQKYSQPEYVDDLTYEFPNHSDPRYATFPDDEAIVTEIADTVINHNNHFVPISYLKDQLFCSPPM